MNAMRLGFAGLAALLWAQPSLAGPCTAEIDRAQAQLDQRVDAIAGAGATGTQSTAAQVHRQPTPAPSRARNKSSVRGRPSNPR